MSDKPFKSLLNSENVKYRERWAPQAVSTYKSALKIDTSIKNSEALLSNLAYNMQYLEFLEVELKELHLHSVIETMLIKTYVITGISIIEGLFTNIVKSNGWQRKSNLESIGIATANKKSFGDKEYVVKTEIFVEVPEHDERMDFEALIKILDNHRKALNVDRLVYPALKRLKGLRNRVHLQKSDKSTDHDYNAFDPKVKKEMQKILYEILTSNMVTAKPHVFDFLK